MWMPSSRQSCFTSFLNLGPLLKRLNEVSYKTLKIISTTRGSKIITLSLKGSSNLRLFFKLKVS